MQSTLTTVARSLAAGLALVTTVALAHHGWSDYDSDKPLTLTGTIKSSNYGNPHASIVLDADGKSYEVVLAPVSRMEARGATRESVAVGKGVTVTGYPSRTHAGEVRAERIVFKEGAAEKTVELR